METDPVSTMFGAKTLSFIVEPQEIEHWSLFLNAVSADFPKWVDDLLNPKNRTTGLETKIILGGGFAIDYFPKVTRKGYYFGLINLIFNNRIIGSSETKESLSHNIIPRIGYRWYPFTKANFYINPFLGLRYEYLLDDHVTVNGQKFRGAGFGPFGTVHIGYHF